MDGELARFLNMTVFDKNQLSRHYSLTVLMFWVLAMTILIDLKQIRPKMTIHSFKPINAYYNDLVKNIVIGFRLVQLVNLLHHLRFRETRPRRSKLKIPNFLSQFNTLFMWTADFWHYKLLFYYYCSCLYLNL